MGGAVQDSQMLRKGIDTSQRILTGGGWLEFKRPVRVAQILVLLYVSPTVPFAQWAYGRNGGLYELDVIDS